MYCNFYAVLRAQVTSNQFKQNVAGPSIVAAELEYSAKAGKPDVCFKTLGGLADGRQTTAAASA